MTPRLLGGKETWGLAHKMIMLSLDKTGDAYRIGAASVVAYRKSATPGAFLCS